MLLVSWTFHGIRYAHTKLFTRTTIRSWNLGPCRVTNAADDPTFFQESWNSNANIFFVDQPVGVGFSYAEYGQSVVRDSSCASFYFSEHGLQSTSEEAAQDIAAFVAIFFESFPSFKGRSFHMAGESYGVCFILTFYQPWCSRKEHRTGTVYPTLRLCSV